MIAAEPTGVGIYQLSRGFETWCWLCAPCLAKRQAAGWLKAKEKPAPFPLTCDDCVHEAIGEAQAIAVGLDGLEATP